MTPLLSPAPFLLQATGGATSPLLPFLFQIAAIFGIFYFLMIRPQQKQRKQHEERLRTGSVEHQLHVFPGHRQLERGGAIA